MGDVVHFPSGGLIKNDNESCRSTSASFRKPLRSDEFTVENVRKIAAQYGQTPAWVTAAPALNNAVTTLRQCGWRVDCWPSPKKILCYHPRVDSGKNGIDIIYALEIQLAFNERQNGGVA